MLVHQRVVYIPECCMFQEGLAPSVEPGGQIYIGDDGESWSIDLRHVDFGINVLVNRQKAIEHGHRNS